MQTNLYSYLPEMEYGQFKSGNVCRNLTEDCAVFKWDGTTVTPLAERGEACAYFSKALLSLPSDCIDLAEELFFESENLLLQYENRAVLVYGALYRSTGILFCIIPKGEYDAVRRSLAYLGYTSFRTLTEEAPPAPIRAEDAACCTDLHEVLFYTDRIFSSVQSNPFSHCVRIANFTGFQPKETVLPVQFPCIERREWDAVTALLLCIFIAQREQDGSSHVVGEPEKDSNVLQISVNYIGNCGNKNANTLWIPDFLKEACFQGFSLYKTSSGWAMQALLHQAHRKGLLHSVNTGLELGFRIEIKVE